MSLDASDITVPSLSSGQYATVYNLFSLVIASMLFTALFLLMSRGHDSTALERSAIEDHVVNRAARDDHSVGVLHAHRAEAKVRAGRGEVGQVRQVAGKLVYNPTSIGNLKN